MNHKTQIKSTVLTGTAPIAVESTTLVENLNAGLLDGQHGSYYLPATNFTLIDRFGFTNNAETTIAFDGTNTFSLTIAAPATSFSYFRDGLLYTISQNKTVDLAVTAPATAGTYFIYIDGTNGDLIVGTAWDLADSKVPVAVVMWNNALTPKYHLMDERHTCLIDRNTHRYEHLTAGTQLISTGLLTGGTLNTSTDSAKVVGVPETKIADEDLFQTLAALATPNGATAVYTNFYRTSLTAWTWVMSIMPFKYTTTGFIEYDSAGTMTPITNGRYANTYVFASNITGDARFSIISGRGNFANTTAAYAESFATFDMTGFPVQEGVAIYQFTWRGITNAGTGQCQLVRIQRITNNVITTAISQVVDHNGLANLQGGGSGEYYHLTSAQHTDLTDGGNTTLHTHDSKMNIDGSNSNIDELYFDTTPTSTDTLTEGQLRWNSLDKTLDIGLAGGVVLQTGQETSVYTWNDTLSTIPDGSPVYITGSHASERITVALASASTLPTSYVIGVTTQDITPSGEGFVTTEGIVRGIVTSSFNEGDALWLSTTGTITNVAPAYQYPQSFIGWVIKKGGVGVGSIYVYPKLLERSSDTPLTDLSNHFTATNVDTALEELYTNKLNIDQTTPQTMIGTFTFPTVSTNNEVLTNGGITSGTNTIATADAGQVLDTTDVAVARTIKYMIQATYGTTYLATEIFIIHNGTDTYLTEYKSLLTGSALATFSANISGGLIRLLVSPVNGGTVFKFIKTYINI